MSSTERTPLTSRSSTPPPIASQLESSSGKSTPAQRYARTSSSSTAYSPEPSMRSVQHDGGGQASVFTSVANLLNVIIGAGICAMPYSFAAAGIVPGAVLVVLSGSTTALGLFLLTRCAARLGGSKTSFFTIASAALPSARQAIDAAIAIKCFGVAISYLMIAGQLMPQVTASLARILTGSSDRLLHFLYTRQFWVAAWALILAPLCFLRRLDSLRHTSYVSFLAVCYLSIIVVYYYFVPPPVKVQARSLIGAEPPERGDVHWFRMTGQFLSVSPVYVFAFTCAHNVLSVYNELETHTQKRTNAVIYWSTGLSGVLYQMVAILGYATFGSTVSPNIIASYPSDSLFVCGGRLAIVALTLMSYPLTIHPCRASLANIYAAIRRTPHASDTPEHQALVADVDAPSGMDPTPVPTPTQVENVPPELGAVPWGVVTVVLVVSTTSIALAVEDLSIVLGFVGSIGSTTISFILPGLLYFCLFRTSDPQEETPEGQVRPSVEDGHEQSATWSPEELQKLRTTRQRTLKASIGLFVWGVVVLIVTLTANVLKVLRP